MKIRCDLHVNGSARKLLLVPGPNETGERLALKLAAYLLFWGFEPKVDASVKTPALSRFEFLPDLIGLDSGGEIVLWVDCQTTTMNKLDKLVKRLPYARLVVLKENARTALRLRADAQANLAKPERVEIIAFPDGGFSEWLSCVREKTEVFGESSGLMINAVVNEHPIVAELKAY
ncbi:MAG: YaeQ family protein [Elusimicrobia bacterium]|nr:YaeQ family protein [Elusimicrobiota bacterium]